MNNIIVHVKIFPLSCSVFQWLNNVILVLQGERSKQQEANTKACKNVNPFIWALSCAFSSVLEYSISVRRETKFETRERGNEQFCQLPRQI
jgi:hypothetical protein